MSNRLNLLTPEFIENPHPYLAELRRSGPIVQVDPGGMWVVTRFDDAQYVLKSPQLFSSQGLRMGLEPASLGRPNPIVDSLIFQDPPEHGRLRVLVSRAFTPATLAQLDPRIRAVTQALVRRMMEERKVDFVDAFAVPLPATVLGWFLGLDPSLQRHFKRWTHSMAAIGAARPEDTALMEQCRRTLGEMEQYCQGVLAERRRSLGDDIVSNLLRVEVDGEALTDRELMGFFFLLISAGLETTTSLLCHCVRVFAMNPGLLLRLRENRALIPRFIEETLRYEPSLMTTMRLCRQDVKVAGVALPQGALVLVSLASASRDEKYFPDGDRFVLEREGPPQLSFGHGPHFCLGAMLARLEARVALEEMVSSVGRLELWTEHIEWTPSFLVRAPQALPVELFPV
ncbi:cytochrome P450 [Corallococcus terminator]